MLRVGLTGDLGSGKSTVARLLAGHGAIVLSSDDMARAMMQPGEPVYAAIVKKFGSGVVDAAGGLDRGKLARLAFDPEQPRVEELNALIHPPVLAAQEREVRRLTVENPRAVVAVESALIFSVQVAGGDDVQTPAPLPWRSRFDCVVVVTAARAMKVDRFVRRVSAGRAISESDRSRLQADAARRLDLQAKTSVPRDASVLLLDNDGSEEDLRSRVARLWEELMRREQAIGDAGPV